MRGCIPIKDAREMAMKIFLCRNEFLEEKESRFLEEIYENQFTELTEDMSKWLNDIYDKLMK